ncbi:hypothetical protein Hanom_Chr13g01214871 [Helianthus anomalus]
MDRPAVRDSDHRFSLSLCRLLLADTIHYSTAAVVVVSGTSDPSGPCRRQYTFAGSEIESGGGYRRSESPPPPHHGGASSSAVDVGTERGGKGVCGYGCCRSRCIAGEERAAGKLPPPPSSPEGERVFGCVCLLGGVWDSFFPSPSQKDFSRSKRHNL